MEYGLQLANLEWQQLRDRAQIAEDLGFSVLTVPDHIVMEGPERSFDPHHLAYDPMLMVAILAEATSKARVGHLVLCNLFRHPVITAQSLASLDQLSGGRLIAGLGTGWTEREFRMTGIPFPDKPGYIKLANVAKLTSDAFAAKVQFVRAEAARHGRNASAIRISNVIFSTILTNSPAATKATAEGMAPMFGTTPEGMLRAPMSLIGTPEECVAELHRRQREWDVSQIVFSGGLDEPMLRRLADEIMPHV